MKAGAIVRQIIWIRNGLYDVLTQDFSMWTSPTNLSKSIVVRKYSTDVSDDFQQTAANHSNCEPKPCSVQKPLASICQGGDCKQNQEREIGSQRWSVAPIGVAERTSVPIAAVGVFLMSATVRSTDHFDQPPVQQRCHNEPGTRLCDTAALVSPCFGANRTPISAHKIHKDELLV